MLRIFARKWWKMDLLKPHGEEEGINLKTEI